MGRISHIDKYNLGHRVRELKLKNKTDNEISETIKNETGIEISRKSINRYFQKHDDAVKKKLTERKEEEERLISKSIEERIDIMSQLKEINSYSILILKKALLEDNPTVAIRAIREVKDQLEFQARLIGVEQYQRETIIQNQITNVVNTNILSWEKMMDILEDILDKYPDGDKIKIDLAEAIVIGEE